VGGALVAQIKGNPAPFVGALVAVLVALGLLRRRRG
jgi:MYXO-CTERM domain-containing protein